MPIRFARLWLGLLALSTAQAQSSLATFTGQANAFLQQYVHEGNVDYKRIHQQFSSIETLYAQVGKMDLSRASPAEKEAFYLNAYNLVVIYQVVKYYPLKSALDAAGGGFFNKLMHRVAGEMLTLNQLEKEKLLEPYADARLHFTLACAARGCPPLASFAYNPLQLDTQLTGRTQRALNDPTFIRVSTRTKTVAVSKIFEWYLADFRRNGKSVLSFVNTYRSNKIPVEYTVSYYEYDWGLNGQ